MDKLRIHGGQRLRGAVRVGGAKNAALPELAACLLTDRPLRVSNLPQVRDVRSMLQLVEQLGAEVEAQDDRAELRVAGLRSAEAPYDLVRKMRASILVLGPLVARFGRARVSLPGGCAIGERPVNWHVAGLEKMGARIELVHGYIEARAGRLRGATIEFPGCSVTGTENLMMAATLAEGTTVLENCAREPEVVDLARLLQAMGASIEGAGTERIVIEGRPALEGAEHAVIPDRIEAGTYLAAAALVGDGVEVQGCVPADLAPVLRQLERVGVPLEARATSVHVGPRGELVACDLETAPHPGFPTDMQAQYMALMTQARGTSRIVENVFERRFVHVGELARMGAEIRIDGPTCEVVGPRPLTGAPVMATDLRASASLVLAALVASGTTVVNRVYHLDRGYESMERKLAALGAAVERIA